MFSGLLSKVFSKTHLISSEECLGSPTQENLSDEPFGTSSSRNFCVLNIIKCMYIPVNRIVYIWPDMCVWQNDAVGGRKIISHHFKHRKHDMEAEKRFIF